MPEIHDNNVCKFAYLDKFFSFNDNLANGTHSRILSLFLQIA